MIVSVDHIQDKPLSFQLIEPVESFPVLAKIQEEGGCRFSDVIRGTLTVAREFDHIRTEGVLTVPVTLTCSRCLAVYDIVLNSVFTVFYRKGTGNTVAFDEDETELHEKDLVSAEYSGDSIDLTHEIEEQLAMEIPLKPLCANACRGLCHVCGIDLNSDSCSCTLDAPLSAFAVLKNFKPTKG